MRPALSIAVAQPPCVPRDAAANALIHASIVRQAGTRVVVFPELSLTGYELDADAISATDGALGPIVAACQESGSTALVGAPVLDHHRRGYIAMVRIDAAGATVAYRKMWLGGDEPDRFSPGPQPVALEVAGWRLGLGICRDTGVVEHTSATAALGIDVFVAGLVHLPQELEEQEARALRIAQQTGAYVAFASFAGPTGGGFDRTAGRSAIWAPNGMVLAQAGTASGEIAQATIGR